MTVGHPSTSRINEQLTVVYCSVAKLSHRNRFEESFHQCTFTAFAQFLSLPQKAENAYKWHLPINQMRLAVGGHGAKFFPHLFSLPTMQFIALVDKIGSWGNGHTAVDWKSQIAHLSIWIFGISCIFQCTSWRQSVQCSY